MSNLPDSVVRELIGACKDTMRFVKACYADNGRIVGGGPAELYARCESAVKSATRPYKADSEKGIH